MRNSSGVVLADGLASRSVVAAVERDFVRVLDGLIV